MPGGAGGGPWAARAGRAPPHWRPALESVAPLAVWERIIAVLPDDARPGPGMRSAGWRPTDVAGLAALDLSIAWISETWGGHAGLAASGTAWVAVADGRPVAVATPFFVGTQNEDIGVVDRARIPRPRAVDVVRRRGRRRHPGPRMPPDLDDEPGEHGQPRRGRPAGLRARARRRPLRRRRPEPAGPGRVLTGRGYRRHRARGRHRPPRREAPHAALSGQLLLRGELRHPRLAEHDLAGRTVLGVRSVPPAHPLRRRPQPAQPLPHGRPPAPLPARPAAGGPARVLATAERVAVGLPCTTWSSCRPPPRTASWAPRPGSARPRLG